MTDWRSDRKGAVSFFIKMKDVCFFMTSRLSSVFRPKKRTIIVFSFIKTRLLSVSCETPKALLSSVAEVCVVYITQTTPTPSYQSIFYDQKISDGDEQTLQQTYSSKRSASCVQSFDDSLDSAIRMTYRISLRSSSLWEPRHPLNQVLFRYFSRIFTFYGKRPFKVSF